MKMQTKIYQLLYTFSVEYFVGHGNNYGNYVLSNFTGEGKNVF